jgi:hypothetical protein
VAGGVVGATGVAVVSSVVVVFVFLSRSVLGVVTEGEPPTPRSEGESFGCGSLPPALAISTITRTRKTAPPTAAATIRLRR